MVSDNAQGLGHVPVPFFDTLLEYSRVGEEEEEEERWENEQIILKNLCTYRGCLDLIVDFRRAIK